MTSTFRRNEAAPFTAVAVALMIGIGCLALLAAVGIAAVASNLRDGSPGGGHALSYSAIGYGGLVELLNDSGVATRVGREDLTSGPATRGLLILTPEIGSKLRLDSGLHHEGPVLVILPKWIGIDNPKHPGWIYNGGLLDQAALVRSVAAANAHLVKGLGAPVFAQVETSVSRDSGVQRPTLSAGGTLFQAGTRMDFGPIAALQTLAIKGWTPALIDGRGRALLMRAPDSQLFVLSDPDLISNHGLASLASARSAVALIDALRGDQRTVVFDVTLNGFSRPRSLLSTFLRPPLLPATLCVLAAALLMGLHAAVRFGPAKSTARAIALGKSALLETSAAVIHRAGRAPNMAPRYAMLTRALAAKSVGAPARSSIQETDAILDSLTATEVGRPTFSALAARAAAVTTLPELLAASRDLFQWRLAVIHDGR